MLTKLLKASLPQSSAYQALVTEIRPQRLASSFIAGTITGIIGVIRAISYAALIFSGGLASDLNLGVGIAILSSAIISIVVALTSSLPGMIATPLAAPTVVLTMLAATVFEQLTPAANHETILLTVITAIAVGSLLTGAVLWLLGQLQWGDALDFLPYPVIGGFMAGTGLLLVRGAFKVMTDLDLSFAHLTQLGQMDHSLHWLAGLAIAGVLLWSTNRFHCHWVMPAVLLLSALVFYGTAWIYQVPLDVIRERGWLLGPFGEGGLWYPLNWDSLSQVSWLTLIQSGHLFGLLVFVSLLSLVLTNTSIELALEKPLDINRELKAVGLANLAAGLGSTMAGNQALPSTLLVHRLGAASRFTGLFKTLPCFVVLFLGPAFLNYFPKPILGSLLLYLGLGLLWQWLFQIWPQLPVTDYVIIWVTLGVINAVGFLAGIGVGIGLAVLQFLWQCSRFNTVVLERAESEPPPGDTPTSTGDVTLSDLRTNYGEAIEQVNLQGILFFGTAKALRQQLCDRILQANEATPLRYLILNFQAVISMDSSAVVSLNKLASLAKNHGCTLVFCQLSEACEHQLRQNPAFSRDHPEWFVFTSCGQALEFCQQQLSSQPAPTEPGQVLSQIDVMSSLAFDV